MLNPLKTNTFLFHKRLYYTANLCTKIKLITYRKFTHSLPAHMYLCLNIMWQLLYLTALWLTSNFVSYRMLRYQTGTHILRRAINIINFIPNVCTFVTGTQNLFAPQSSFITSLETTCAYDFDGGVVQQ